MRQFRKARTDTRKTEKFIFLQKRLNFISKSGIINESLEVILSVSGNINIKLIIK